MKRIASIFVLAVAFMAMVVPSAQALLTIAYRSSAYAPGFAPNAAPGDTFNVNVFVSYQASPPDLLSIFTSSRWDPTELELLGATIAPGSILGDPNLVGLVKLSDPRPFSFDPPGTLRTIQFGALPSSIPVTPAQDVLITTLTFRVLSQGISSLPVEAFIAFGDDIAAGQPDGGVRSLSPPDFQFLHLVPEPGTALLLGMGLAALAGSRERARFSLESERSGAVRPVAA